MLIEENPRAEGLCPESYRNGVFEINGHSYNKPLALTDCLRVLPPDVQVQDLSAIDFLQDGADLPELIVVGTGEKQQFLHPRIAAELAAQGIGLECMNTAAACRTLLLLQGEGRKVWAWLWP